MKTLPFIRSKKNNRKQKFDTTVKNQPTKQTNKQAELLTRACVLYDEQALPFWS
jgi:hypothetical protein